MSRPDVSVVIPTYNYAHFLDGCLRSVYSQAGVSVETIVVDDGSTDDTPALAARHADRIRYIRQENAGSSAARNTGMKASSGRYIQLLDADDLLGPGSLQGRVQLLSGLPERSVAVCKISYFSRTSSRGKPAWSRPRPLYTTHLDTHLCRLNLGPPHRFLFPRAMFDEIGGVREDYRGCEDYDYWLRALGAGYSFHYCADARVYYREHQQSKGSHKARQGAYPFDVLVHKQMDSGYYGAGLDRLLAEPTGSLAVANGTLMMALRINKAVNAEGQRALVDIVSRRLNRALDSGVLEQRACPLEARLYAWRLMSLRAEIHSLGHEELARTFDRLASTMHGRALADATSGFPYQTFEQQALVSAIASAVFRKIT